ncbi:MAG: hypothetical protein U9N32_02220, partial [Spirochaetota bacterium]|nr:hypothetical protein [Spirochaetota bacterium]
MSSKGSLAGRLGRIRTSRDNKKVFKRQKEPITLLKSPWKQLRPFVSLSQKIFISPFTTKT